MKITGAEGTRFSTAPFVLGDRLQVGGLARALDIDEPVLLETPAAQGAGLRGRPVPPYMYAFFLTASPEALTERLGFDWGRTLAAGMEFESCRVATEADLVVGESVVESAWERAGSNGVVRQFLRLRTDFRLHDGSPICRWRVTFLERTGERRDPGTGSADDATPPDPLGEALITSPPPDPARVLADHRTGPMSRLRLANITAALDNPDPIHVDHEAARAAGLDDTVGQGSASIAVLCEPVRRWAGLDRIVGGSIRLAAPWGVGAELVATARRTSDPDTPRMAICDSTLLDGEREVGSARLMVTLEPLRS